MIYTMGCSMTKWIWPTWSDWLQVYNEPVTNLANKGYGNQTILWTLMDRLKTFTPDDHIIIMWAENHRVGLWYDKPWIEEKDVLGFFPDTHGKLWFSKENNPYVGLYRTHPDLQPSFTQMVIDKLQTVLFAQLLLDKVGCSYSMHSSGNLWRDGRPIFYPKYQTVYQNTQTISKTEIEIAKGIIALDPVKEIINQINWTKFVDTPKNILNPAEYTGIWEYYITNKEYVSLKHDDDHHPHALAHHDYALEKILQLNPKTGVHRDIARKIAVETMSIPIPSFSTEDFVISADTQLLDEKYKKLLDGLK